MFCDCLQLQKYYLTKLYENTDVHVPKKKETVNTNFKTKKKEACKLFLKGPCRFGAKCKFLHETNVTNENPIESDTKNSDKIIYELEIRFPEDTLYPFQPPHLFLKLENNCNIIPETTCLKVTAKLFEEAKTFAQDGIPSIYSLVELLNNEEEILNFIKFDTRTFPDASDALCPELIENEEKEMLPSHYKRVEARDNRSNINFEGMIKENEEIAKRWLEKRDNNRYNKLMSGRRNLPAWKKKNEILEAIDKSQVYLITIM